MESRELAARAENGIVRFSLEGEKGFPGFPEVLQFT